MVETKKDFNAKTLKSFQIHLLMYYNTNNYRLLPQNRIVGAHKPGTF